MHTFRPVRAADRVFEFALNAFRLRDGFAFSTFERRTGLSRDRLAPGLGAAERSDLIHARAGGVRASARGWRFLDDLVACFLPPGREAGGPTAILEGHSGAARCASSGRR